MIFVVDIGNTNIVASVFDDDKILCQWRIATDTKRTSDEYASIIFSLIRDNNLKQDDFSSSIISSVVPDLIGAFVTVCTRLCGKKPFIVTAAMVNDGTLPVQMPFENNEVGSDLICNAVSAWKMFGKANIVVDFGTALSTICTDSKGIIRGVTITPGLGTAVHSLSSNTAQLPTVPLVAPKNSLGLNTVTAIQSGIVLGYKGLVEYLVKQIKTDLAATVGENPDEIVVVATGGLNSVLKPITDCFTIVDKDLTVKGLKAIFDILNKK